MNEKTNGHEAKTGGVPNKGSLQAYLHNFTKESIDEIVKIMRTSRQESLRFAAARAILDKTIPDMKAVEVTGKDGEPIKLSVIAGNGFIPQLAAIEATSTGGAIQPSSEVQGVDLAPESMEDNNSDNRISQASTS